MNISPNRVVAIATPLLFAPLAGAVTALAAKHAPGLEIDQGQLQAIFIAGATIAVAKAGLWMRGWQEYEKHQEVVPADALEPANGLPNPGIDSEPDMDDDADVDGEGEAEFDAAGHLADLGDEGDEEDPDDLLAELEAALAEADAARATSV